MTSNIDLRINGRWGQRSKRSKRLFWVLTLALGTAVFSTFYPAWFGNRGVWFNNESHEDGLSSNTTNRGVDATRMANGVSLVLLTTGYLLELSFLAASCGPKCARNLQVPSQLFLIGGFLGMTSFGFSWLTVYDSKDPSASSMGWASVTSGISFLVVSVISTRIMVDADKALTFAWVGIRYLARVFYAIGQLPVTAFDACMSCWHLGKPPSRTEGLEDVIKPSRLKSYAHMIDTDESARVSEQLRMASARGEEGRGRNGPRGLDGTVPMLPAILEEAEERELVNGEPTTGAEINEAPYPCDMEPASETLPLQDMASDPPEGGCAENADDAAAQEETSLALPLLGPQTQGIST